MKTLTLSLALFILSLLAGCASAPEKAPGLTCSELTAKLAPKRRAATAGDCESLSALPDHK